MGPGVYEGDYGGTYDTPCFFALHGGDRSLTGAAVEEPLGDAGVLKRFTIGLNAAPGTGTWTFSLMRGSDALLSCTISGSSRTCQGNGNKLVSATDKLYIRCEPGTGVNTPSVAFTAAAFQVKYVN